MGNGFFHDATRSSGAGLGTLAHVTWGNGFVDFDSDGDRDLFIACGHTEDNIERWDKNGSYMAKNVLLMNTGAGKFVDELFWKNWIARRRPAKACRNESRSRIWIPE